jgi:AAA domain
MTSALDLTLPAIDELAALGARFVCWRWETRDGRRTKPPINPHTGGYADTTNPGTWADLGTAMAAVERYKLDGVGFVLAAERDGIVGTDLDGCRDPAAGKLATWSQKILAGLRTYTEVSPSGTGVKVLLRADPVPKLLANKRTIGKANGTKPPAVEIYTSGRYFCLTGKIVDGVPDEIVDSTEALEKLAAWVAKGVRQKPPPELPQAFVDLLEHDAPLREAWENGTKLGHGGDASASGLDFSLARYLRRHLDDGDLEAVLRCYPHGQMGSGKLKGRAADKRIAGILAELGPRPEPNKSPSRLQPRTMAALVGQPVPVLKFVVPRWIPWGKLVLLCGRGGVGKTTLTCQLLATTAIGGWFLGMEIPRCRSFALLCEDDWDETHRALARIAEELGRPLGEFTDFDYVSTYGEDNTLVFSDRRGTIKPTPLYVELAERMADEKRDLLALDNTRHIAGINENDNPAVTTACSLLHGLMRHRGGTTLLLGHTPKNGSSEFAGGAAWENIARARLYLGPVAAEANEEPVENDPRRIFRRGKSNATGTDQMNVIWDRGAGRNLLRRRLNSSCGCATRRGSATVLR